jgi:membrane associated rhomboid family serine protease
MEEKFRFFRSMRYPAVFVMLMWLVKGTEMLTHFDLSFLGNYPRTALGVVGIFSSPLVHGDFSHLMSNSLPILILGSLILYFYPTAAGRVVAGIYLLTGISVWLLARPVYHIGASGLVYGFAFFLFFSGVFRNDMKSLAISFFIIFMYGGIVWGLMPNLIGISWETHLFGAIAGSLFAYVFRYMDLQPKESWQMMEESTQPEINYRYIYIPKDKPTESAAPEEPKPLSEENKADTPP